MAQCIRSDISFHMDISDERKRKMKLNEWIKQNEDKEIEFVDGKIIIKEEPKAKTIWDLKIGDKYFVINRNGSISDFIWENGNLDKKFRSQGNVFFN